MPTNTTPATALDITSVPYSITLDANGTPNSTVIPPCIIAQPCNALWWKYTPSVSSPPAIGIRALADIGSNYTPSVSIFTGPVGSLTMIRGACMPKSLTAPLTIPEHGNINVLVTPGVTYYFQVVAPRASCAVALTSLLTFEAVNPYELASDSNDILVLNDALHFSAAILDSSSGSILRNLALEASEHAAWSITGPSGKVLAIVSRDTDASGQPMVAIVLRDDQLELLHTNTSLVIANSNMLWPLSTDYAGTFYILRTPNSTGPRTLVSLSDAGVVGPTTWTLPGLGVQSQFSATALGISRDGTIAYYGGIGNGNGTILRYDLINSIALSDLRGDIGTATVQRDILVMADGTVLVVDKDASRDFKVRHYSAAGTLLHTFSFASSNLSPMRIALGPDDPDSFWAMWFPIAEAVTSRFTRTRISDGAILAEFTVENAEAFSWTSEDPFGPSLSCPILVLPEAIGPPAEVGTIVVIKTTSPSGSTESFPFVATGLTPGTFNLQDGQSQSFTDLTPGTGYAIEETVPSGWIVSYTVSNGSPNTNISVSAGEMVTVAVLNANNSPLPPSDCEVGHGECTPTVGAARIGV